MAEMNHLTLTTLNATPAPARNTGTKAAQGNASKDGANGAQADESKQSFANVLRGKSAPAEPAQKEAKSGTDADQEDAGTDTAKATGAGDAPALSAEAMLAALLPQALRPSAATTAVAGEAAASALAGKTGKEGLKTGPEARDALAQITGDGDARRPRAAGVTEAVADKLPAAGAKDEAATGGTDFSALLGRLRQEGSGKNAAATQAADTPPSTLAMLMPATQITETPAAAAPRPTTLIEAPVGSPLFADEAAQRVTWLAKNGIEHAEIRVTPPDMGPIQVSIDMKANEATINFTVNQPDTRVALEDSLHRLEEMLADSGIALSQANVSQQDAGQGQAGNPGNGRAGGSGRGDGGTPVAEGVGGVVLPPGGGGRGGARVGLVDTFA